MKYIFCISGVDFLFFFSPELQGGQSGTFPQGGDGALQCGGRIAEADGDGGGGRRKGKAVVVNSLRTTMRHLCNR